MVCDVTDKESFDNLKDMWYKEMKNLGPENMTVFVLGNKMDLLTDQSEHGTEEVTATMVKDFAMRRKADYHMVSARKNQGIDEVFQRLGEKLIQT